MYVVALTGGIGSGKTEVSRIFESLNVPVVDVDVISRNLTATNSPVVEQIARTFGKDFIATDGAMDRTKMRDHIFANTSERKKLEALLHPAIHIQACRELDSNKGAPYQILAIPLLFETDRYNSIVNRILLVDCDEATQIARTVARNHLTEEKVRAIMATQVSRAYRRALADDIIENDATLIDLNLKVTKLHKAYMAACQH